jgi:hypothetical protein
VQPGLRSWCAPHQKTRLCRDFGIKRRLSNAVKCSDLHRASLLRAFSDVSWNQLLLALEPSSRLPSKPQHPRPLFPLGFFNTYRQGNRVTRRTLTEIADQFQYWPIGNTMKYVAIANARRGSSLITSFSSGKRRCRRPHSRDAGRGGAHACAVASSALQPLVRGQFQTEGP